MLSRRNVRIKVMQVLYAFNRENANPQLALRHYQKMVDDAYQLYLYNLLVLIRVAEYARQDEIRRHGKLRPSEEDTTFTAKLSNNAELLSLSKNFRFTQAVGRYHLGQSLDADLVRSLYMDFTATEPYKAYMATPDAKHADALLDLYKFLINHETFESMTEDVFPLWSDDKGLIVGAMKKTIKALPATEDFLDEYLPPDETVKEFGEVLLKKVTETDKALLDVIEPSLQNWDAERVAQLDMIVLKMAIAEFLYFPSIPTKVTLNEFVDISKMYSTDKSKEFVNGILDRLLKKLTAEGLVKKQGRGLVD